MRTNTSTQLLASLHPTELKDFNRFLNSPYFNSNQTLIKLFEFLKTYHPVFDIAELSKETIYEHLFPNSSFQYGTLRNLMTELTALLRRFMMQMALEKDQILKVKLELAAYAERKLQAPFNSCHDRLQSELHSAPTTRFNYLEQYQALDQYYKFPLTDRKAIGEGHSQEALKNLQKFYVYCWFIQRMEVISRHSMLNESLLQNDLKIDLPIFLSKLNKKEKPIFQLLISICELQLRPKKEGLPSILQLYKKHYVKLSQADAKQLFLAIINLMNHFLKVSNQGYMLKIYKFHQFGIDYEISNYDHHISSIGFINTVTSATACEEIDWVWDFVQDNAQYLPQNEKGDTVSLANSIIYFVLKEFDKVNKILSQLSLRQSQLSYQHRLLMIKNIIERALINSKTIRYGKKELATIEKYLTRQKGKDSPTKIQSLLNLIKIARRMLYNIQNERAVLNGISTLMRPGIPLSSRNWLLQRIKSLK